MDPHLRFFGGRFGAAIPLLFFVAWAIAISVAGAPDERGLILGMVGGLTLGMLLCRSRWADYANAVFAGMANPVATVTIVAWFWAGMFAQVLRVGGLVDGLAWLGSQSNATGGWFVGATFVLAATFGTAVGTGYGTTVAFCTLMFPAGLILGADPVWLFAAILSGAAFGDNLARVVLAGRLTLPPGQARVPIVVLIHGAEHSSALEDYALQRQFAGAGIGVFAYDKRGTGASGGRYSQNYLILATDAVLAMREARRLAGVRAGRMGYQGFSQGGWVAPLAARIEPVDFVIVSFGLAVSPLDEDREAIDFDMERAGFGPEIKAKAMEVGDATAAIVESNFTEGYEQLEAVKRKYGDEPWFRSVRGNFTAYMLAESPETIRKEGSRLLEGIPAHYDPRPVLTNLEVPQLWILGGQDRDASPGETIRRLAALQKAGRPITTAVFADADHGMYEFETLPDGERISTRQPEGYFPLMRDFIKGKHQASSYGSAEISRCATSSPDKHGLDHPCVRE